MRAIQNRNSHSPNLAFGFSDGTNFWNGQLADTFFARAAGRSMTAALTLSGDELPAAQAHIGAADKHTTDLLGNGDINTHPQGPVFIVTTDDKPGDITTTATLTVNAPSVISTIDTIGDQDFYKVTLNAGQSYEIGMYGYTGGPNGVPNPDSYVEIYDATGHLIVSGDGGADTPANDVNSGFDVLMTYTPDVTGTYYINARAFDQTPVNGETGDSVGDYELFVRDASPTAYHPYYNVDSPLYAIDWGTQVDGTVRNPDGNEGTRDTGNAQGTPDASPFAIAGKNVVTIYFAKAGDVFVSNDPTNPGLPPAIVAVGAQDFEKQAVWTALHEFEKVADVVYVEVQDRSQANFFYVTYNGTPGPGISLLGSMSPPGESDQGLAQFNSGDYRWNATDLQQGGFSFTTLIHEFGHGNGLAHPHDNGGHSGIMHGVEPAGVGTPVGTIPDPVGVWPDYTEGDYDLNQAVYTMMSYQDGWQDSPYGNAPTTGGYGYLGSLMAFDIAAIQDKYGVNEDTATGNDTYVLKDANAPGTYYSSIWDAAGNDSIAYYGARDATIDLRPATLQYENGGGGWISYAYGIYGGFTIANGVTIENAYGGSGNDTLIGNDVANTLFGGVGADTLIGGAGNDTYVVDTISDAVIEGANGGNDTVYATASYRLDPGVQVETLSTADWSLTTAIDLIGNELSNTMYGNAGNNLMFGGGGADNMMGLAGNDSYVVDNLDDQVWENAGNGTDAVYATFSYTLAAGNYVEILSTADQSLTDAINLTGNEMGQQIYGNAGANVLNGGGGADLLAGFGGADTFAFTTALGNGNVDAIAQFVHGEDKIALDDAIFTGLGLGSLDANAFFAGSAAHDADDRIIYDSSAGVLMFDADGSGAGAAIAFAYVAPGTSLSASDFQVI